MRTKKITKFALFILFIYIFSTNSIFALYSPDEVKSAFFNIENINYSPTTVNTESEYQTGNTVNGAKVIKITEINSSTTWSESYRAIPHINIANYTATIYNEGNSSDCRLLVKTTVDYDDLGEKTTWFEIDDVKTYIYRRVYLEEEADSFELTFYYLIENPSNVLDSNGDSSQFLSLDTGASTNYYLFYLENDVNETSFYFGNLSDSLFTQTTPIEFNPEYSSFLQVNATRPASWDPGNFFNNLGQNNLEWMISLKAGLPSSASSSDSYYVGLTITSENGFILKSQDSGDGIKEFPYQIRLSKRNANSNLNQTVEVNSYDKLLVRNISDNVSRYFYIYTYSNNSTYNLNAGKFSDNIYLNFVTGDDINSSYGDKTITIFN